MHLRTRGTIIPQVSHLTEPGFLAERRIHPLLAAFARERDVFFDSCLDVGCGRSRYDQWFERFDRSREGSRYIGLETDPQIISELVGAGVDVRNALEGPGECRSDLVLCIEVIEHLTPAETPAFMEFVAANTQKVMALTTPNFEYWDNLRQRPEYRECRWIPDHFPFFKIDGGPHHHKQAMTPQTLKAYLDAAFPAREWETRVYRAWPWRLEDQVTGEAFEMCFKLFALAWNRRAIDEGGAGS